MPDTQEASSQSPRVNLPGSSRTAIASWRRHELGIGGSLFGPRAVADSPSSDEDAPRVRAPMRRQAQELAAKLEKKQQSRSDFPLSPRAAYPVPSYLQHSSFYPLMFTYPSTSTSPLVDRHQLGLESRPRSAASTSRSPPQPTVVASFRPTKSLLAASLSTSTSTGIADQAAIGLPTHWDNEDRCTLVEVSSDGLGISFVGSGKNGDRDAAAVRANRPMPAVCGIYYYEVEIVSKGQHGYIGVGFSALSVNLSRLPGWEPQSWGYHGDDGHSFASKGEGRAYGPTFTTGDIVGCGIDFSRNQAFFTKNGTLLGYVFDHLPSTSMPLYPSVGLRTPGEIVRGNFGARPYSFAIELFVRDRVAEIDRTVLSARISERLALPAVDPLANSRGPKWPAGSAEPEMEAERMVGNTAQELIAAYLGYHGFADTARAFEKQRGEERAAYGQNLGFKGAASTSELPAPAPPMPSSSHITERQQLCRMILEGDAAQALEVVRERMPDALPLVERSLRRLVFAELVVKLAEADRLAAETMNDDDEETSTDDDARAEMLACGRALDADYGSADPLLRETFGLLACADPAAERPDLAGEPARRTTADLVNSAVLSTSQRHSRFSRAQPRKVKQRSLPSSWRIGTRSQASPRWVGKALARLR